jgi:hypothetical protein
MRIKFSMPSSRSSGSRYHLDPATRFVERAGSCASAHFAQFTKRLFDLRILVAATPQSSEPAGHRSRSDGTTITR